MKSEGELELTRPDRVRWSVVKPAPIELVMEGKKVSMTSGGGAEKRVESFSLDKQMDEKVSKSLLTMIAWLKIDVPAIVAAYNILRLGENEYLCNPKESEGAVFKSLKLKLHPKGHLERLWLDENSGDSIELEFSNPVLTFQK